MHPAVKTLCLVAVSSMLGFASPAADADQVLYRWLDDRGHPVHSDRPPPAGTDYEVISTRSSLVRPVAGDEGAVPLEVEPRVGNEFEPVDKTPAKSEKNPELCQRARDNLETLDTRPRIRVRNDQGEYYFLDEEGKEERRAEARDAIARYCD